MGACGGCAPCTPRAGGEEHTGCTESPSSVAVLGHRARSPDSDTQAKMDLLGEEEVARVRWVKYVGTERNLTIGGKKISKWKNCGLQK